MNGYEYGYGDISNTIYHDIVYYGEDCLYETNAAPAKEVKSNVSQDINQIIDIGKTWLEHGCIIFSQYYDTAEWIAKELAKSFKDEVVAVCMLVAKVAYSKGEQFNNVEREVIKSAVKTREIRLVVATDAACERFKPTNPWDTHQY